MNGSDARVLFLAPTPGDAALCKTILADAGIVCHPCADLERLEPELETGAAVLLLTEESLSGYIPDRLRELLHAQPEWSDLPVLLLANRGADSPTAIRAMEMLGNVTVLERPVRVLALVSTVRAALRGRRRQYELRDHLDALGRAQERLLFSEECLRHRLEEIQTLVNVLPVGVFMAHDPTGASVDTNRAGAALLGAERAAARSMEHTARTGIPVDGEEIEIVRPDGAKLTLYQYASPLFDQDGRVRGCVGAMVDVTPLKAAERALRASEERFRRLVETAGEGIWEVDRHGRTTYVNQRMAEMLGTSTDQMIGGSPSLFVWPEDREPNDGPWELSAEAQTVEWRLRRADGSELWTQSASTPIRDVDGEIVGEFSMVMDITARKRAEEALREADRRKDDFLATLAHELRNPLAPLQNGIRILEQLGSRKPEAVQTHQMMGRQVGHMVHLIDDLLDVSRIARGKVQLSMESCDLVRIVHDTALDYRSTLENSGLGLRITLPDRPAWVFGDSTRLAQVVGNLLHNANKFTAPGGEVAVTVDLEGDEATVTVSDMGIGIDPGLLGAVFEPFSQAAQGPDRKSGGLGLGLALVRGLVEQHGGSVTAHSDGPGHGSTFQLRIPLQIADASRPARPSMRDGDPLSPGRHRILVVDDNEDSADSLAMLLEITGHEVRTANDGLRAIEEAQDFVPDVILLDIGLPGLSGLDVARRLREMPFLRSALIIAQTGYGQDEDRRRSLEAGFDHHLTKPLDLAELKKVLEERV